MDSQQIKEKKVYMAICYDFDRTLSPDDMQTFTLIPSLNMDAPTFWSQTNELAKENLMDKNLAWMQKLIVESKAKRKPLTKDYFHNIGKDVILYDGVKEWFSRINEYGKSQGIEVEHYIISSGLKELIEGTAIASEFKRIYASSYLYDVNGVAEWPAQSVNYTNKTQFLFRISKGIFEEYDDSINDVMPLQDLYIPYTNMVYIGDSQTDIPCMKLIKDRQGYSIGVYDPIRKSKQSMDTLIKDKRINFCVPTDYRENSDLDILMHKIIDNIKTKSILKKAQDIMFL